MKRNMSARLKTMVSPNSLRIQLLSRTLLIMALLLVLIGLLQYVFMRDVIYRNKASSLRSQVMSVSMEALENIVTSPVNNTNGLPRIFNPETKLAYIDINGNYSVLSEGHENGYPPQLDIQVYKNFINIQPDQSGKLIKHDRDPNYIIVNDGGAEHLVVLQPIISFQEHKVVGVIQISTLAGPLKDLLIRQMVTFYLLALVALLFGLLAFMPVLKKTLIPLSNMVNTAEQIDSGNLDRRFPIRQGQTEIDSLAESFNGMLERLQISFETEKETQEMMRRFIADASHELRTPLTSIHGFLEVLIRGAVNQPEQLDKALNSMHSESKRLNKLVHDLLMLSKLDRTTHSELTLGSLDSVINTMEPQLRILAGNRKVYLLIEPNMQCKFDIDQMKQVILNVFQNAVQHTDSELGEIKISLKNKDQGVLLSISDNGPGIGTEHLPHVFDRFYRSDFSRTRIYGGAGLGLSITKSIVEAHGGNITVISKEGEGATFLVWLPC